MMVSAPGQYSLPPRGAASFAGGHLEIWLRAHPTVSFRDAPKAQTRNLEMTRQRFRVRCFAPPRKWASRAQRLLQIRDQIFLVLDADREPHHVRGGARLLYLSPGRPA